MTDLVECLVTGALDAQVDHGVLKGAAHVVLQRQIVHSLKRSTHKLVRTRDETAGKGIGVMERRITLVRRYRKRSSVLKNT